MNAVYFDEIEGKLIANLLKAQRKLKIAMAWFKSPAIFEVVLERQSYGVSVEVILADDISNFEDLQMPFQRLIDAGGVVSIIRRPPLMHHKFCIVDSRILFTGSYNWTRNAKSNYENVIVSTELTLINAFEEEFNRLSSLALRVTDVSSTTFCATAITDLIEDTHELPDIPFINVVTSADVDIEKDDKFRELYEQAMALYLLARHKQVLLITDKLLQMNPDVAEVYDLIAATKWRQGDYKAVVEAANKTIELNNQCYAAYNMLGIGYAGIKNAQKSLNNYAICIDREPSNYTFHWNQSITFGELSIEPGFNSSMRNQFKQKFKTAIETVIELTNQQESSNQSYHLYSIRGQAHLEQGKYLNQAKNDLTKALILYKAAAKSEQDIHVFREINFALKNGPQLGLITDFY